MVDVGDGELVVVDLDVLLQLAIFVPFFNFGDILIQESPSTGFTSEKKDQVQEYTSAIVLVRLTPSTRPSCTRAGSFLTRPLASFPALRPHSIRALSSVARSRALKGTRLARRMVSRREVAVTMCEEPAVRDV